MAAPVNRLHERTATNSAAWRMAPPEAIYAASAPTRGWQPHLIPELPEPKSLAFRAEFRQIERARLYDAARRFLPKPGGRLVDRDLGSDGQCCLWLDPESRWDSRESSALRLFLDELAVFFDRRLIYDLTHEWPGRSYSH